MLAGKVYDQPYKDHHENHEGLSSEDQEWLLATNNSARMAKKCMNQGIWEIQHRQRVNTCLDDWL